jgi:hypothetical protein
MQKYAPTVPGDRFGMLLVLEERPIKYGRHKQWLCRCKCGVEKTVGQHDLRAGRTVSCGCKKVKHLESATRTTAEYRAWAGMIQRCHNPKDHHYADYGGRGIRVCDEWRTSYETFLAHVGRRPSRKHSIDRIRNSQGYKPGNVHWATKVQQARNTRRTRFLTLDGVTKCLTEWAEITGLSKEILWSRLNGGWSVEATLSTPSQYAKGNKCLVTKLMKAA